jgi:hypothetical protein
LSNAGNQRLLIRKGFEGEPIRQFMTPNRVVVPRKISIAALVEDYVYEYHHELFPVMTDSKLLGALARGRKIYLLF